MRVKKKTLFLLAALSFVSLVLLVPFISAAPPTYELTTQVVNSGSINPSSGTYRKNSLVDIQAKAESGWHFDHWQGDLSGSENPTTVRMDSDKHVIAVFVQGTPAQHSLTTAVSGSGSVVPERGTYDENTVVDIQANAESGWHFDHWEGDLPASDNNPTTITMDADKYVIAVFEETGQPDHEIVGYFIQWGVYRRNYHVKNIVDSGSADKLTVINYAFAGIDKATHTCMSLDTYADWNNRYDASESVDGVGDETTGQPLKGNFNQLRKLKLMYPHLKILISIGGWTDSYGFSEAAKPENRVAFVTSCIDMFIKGNFDPENGVISSGIFDGIDIDWEYPGICHEENPNCDPSDTQNFTELLAKFRSKLDEIDPTLILTIAAPAAAYEQSKIEKNEIHQYLDWINLMTYDMYGSWETTTGHQSNLYTNLDDPLGAEATSTDQVVGEYMDAGIPASKLIIGLPFYGRGWGGVKDGGVSGLYQTYKNIPRGKWAQGVDDFKELDKLTYPGFWDPIGQAYWIYDGNRFWSYDNVDSVLNKMNYVKDQELGGVMFWELSGDDVQGTLINAIATGLQ